MEIEKLIAAQDLYVDIIFLPSLRECISEIKDYYDKNCSIKPEQFNQLWGALTKLNDKTIIELLNGIDAHCADLIVVKQATLKNL